MRRQYEQKPGDVWPVIRINQETYMVFNKLRLCYMQLHVKVENYLGLFFLTNANTLRDQS